MGEYTGSTDLIKFERADLSQILTVDGIKPVLKKLEGKVLDKKFDLSTDKGRKENAHMGRMVSSSKVWLLDRCNEEIKAEEAKIIGPMAKIAGTKAAKKKIAPFCDALRDEVKKGLTDYREAEKARIEAEEAAIAAEIDRKEKEREAELAERERKLAEREAEIKRQDDDRKAKEEADRLEKERIEREERLKAEAAEKATHDAEAKAEAEKQAILKREADAKALAEKAEKDRLEAIEQGERDKIAAEERAKLEAKRVERENKEALELAERNKQAAIDAERIKAKGIADQKEADRLTLKALAKAKADRAAANLNHRKRIDREVVEDLVEILGFSAPVAKSILEVIATGKIRHCTINY